MSLEELISTYGYAAVGVGAFLEGETVLFLAGFAANRGYLELPWVMLSAFLGALFGDQFYFYLGRSLGKGALKKRPAWQAKSEKAFLLLERHQVWLIIGFRFLYGLRTITPFIIGASNISPYRFLVLNIIGATLWVTVVGILGYLFGKTLALLVDDFKKYELLVILIIVSIGTIIWFFHLRKK